MKRFKAIAASALLMLSMASAPMLLSSLTASAAPKDELCKGAGGTIGAGGSCDAGGEKRNIGDFIKIIVNILIFIIGAVSVLMIVIGGIRYVVSGGDSSAVSGAKNTILYAIVGVIVAVMAYAIVNFVIGAF